MEKWIVVAGLLVVSAVSHGAIIVDDDVESSNWTVLGSSGGFQSTAAGGRPVKAGTELYKGNASNDWTSFGAYRDYDITLAAGIYTFTYQFGDMSFSLLPGNGTADENNDSRIAIGFFVDGTQGSSGSSMRDAIRNNYDVAGVTYAKVKANVPNNAWAEYQYTLTIEEGCSLIGENVSFGAAFNVGDVSSATGAAFDDLTIDYVIPEPATLGMVSAMGIGALFIRRVFQMG